MTFQKQSNQYTNVIILDVKECTSQDRKVREERDLGGLLQLFKEVEVNPTLDSVKLARREGGAKGGCDRDQNYSAA